MKYYISTACPVVVSYVEKFQPELLDNLAPLVSPMIATAKIVRKLYGENIKVIYIGPCINSKDESELHDKSTNLLTCEKSPVWSPVSKDHSIIVLFNFFKALDV